MTEPLEKLLTILEEHRGEQHAIVLQDYPDPDALSSAFAHQMASERYDIDTQIIFSGRLSHPENIAMVQLLGIEKLRFDPQKTLEGIQGAVFIDNQGTTAQEIVSALQDKDIPVLVIVDHHEVQDLLNADFCDIRDWGATASIYTEYIKGGLLDLDASEQQHINLSTALMHGIITDTGSFLNAKEPDFMAAAYLSHYLDGDLLQQIMSQSRSRQTMEVIQRALANRESVESFSIAGVGYLRVEDRDAISQAADFLHTEENIHTAIVYGIITDRDGREALVGSLRTSKITLNPDEFLKEAFGQDEDGRYFGGGKKTAGGFEIPIGFLTTEFEGDDYDKMKWQVFHSQIRQKLFQKIGVEEEDENGEG